MIARSHTFYVGLMVLVCLMWSISGIVTRTLERAERFEVTFWRSLFAAITVLVILLVQQRGRVVASIRSLGLPGVASSIMWSIMFTCFMLALTMTSTAKAFVVNALYPVFAALLGWLVLSVRPPGRTWIAMLIAVAGVVYMVWGGLDEGGTLGMIVALGVPVGGAVNVVLMRKYGKTVDLIPAVFVGAVLSALYTLPWALPFNATTYDIAALATLGVFQLGIPCALMVIVGRHLPPAEVALISLLEAVLAPLWTWIGVNEVPGRATLIGGAIALSAIFVNELVSYLQSRRSRPT